MAEYMEQLTKKTLDKLKIKIPGSKLKVIQPNM